MSDALYDAHGIQFIGVHDERTGTHMADGYARASGRAGVILAGQNGPGATNLVTGLGQAAAFSPVVLIAGVRFAAAVRHPLACLADSGTKIGGGSDCSSPQSGEETESCNRALARGTTTRGRLP